MDSDHIHDWSEWALIVSSPGWERQECAAPTCKVRRLRKVVATTDIVYDGGSWRTYYIAVT